MLATAAHTGGLGDPLGRHVGRPERLGNDNIRVRKVALELAVRTVPVAWKGACLLNGRMGCGSVARLGHTCLW
jgi:hypothetical protein